MSYSIFEYRKSSSCNFLDEGANGFEVKIEANGIIEYSEFDFEENCLEYKLYQLSQDGVRKIMRAIENNSEVFNVNSVLDNGSDDGDENRFWFSTKKRNIEIVDWNIGDSIDELQVDDSMIRFDECLSQERIVLKLFFEICDILKNEKFKLNLDEFKINSRNVIL